MPIYEFRCEECGHTFTVLCSFSERDKQRCPKCSSEKIRQLFKGFYASGVSGGNGCSSSSCGSCSSFG